jgi:hypothetical protein
LFFDVLSLVRDAVVCLQVYKGLNIESGEVVAVKQVQLNVINAEQLDSASFLACMCSELRCISHDHTRHNG